MDGLYDDLDTSQFALANSIFKKKYDALLVEHEKLKQECGELQQVNSELGEQNVQMEKNFCVLYETAKRELSRKDEEIKRLRKTIQYVMHLVLESYRAMNPNPTHHIDPTSQFQTFRVVSCNY